MSNLRAVVQNRTLCPVPKGHGIARAAIVVLAMMLTSGCSALFGSDESALGGGDAGPECPRDREALSVLLVQPQSCATSAECPDGAHCDAASGQCNWECYSDSDCGMDSTCTCDGRCIAGGDAGPEPTGFDPACPRDETLLEDIVTGDITCIDDGGCPKGTRCDATGFCSQRACVFDEDCPYGSQCDRSSGMCSWSCLGTDHPTHGCTGTEVCDCKGQCVEPGAEEGCQQPSTTPTLSLSSRILEFTSADTIGTSKDITLEIRTKDPAYFDDTANGGSAPTKTAPQVTLTAPPEFALGQGPVAELVLATWTFDLVGDEYVATNVVSVQNVVVLDDAEGPWIVKVRSEGLKNGWQTLLLGSTGTPTGPAPTSGEYKGYLVRKDTDPNAPAFRIPVQAWADSTSEELVLYDPTRTLSATGSLSVPMGGAAVEMRWFGDEYGAGDTVASARFSQDPTFEAGGRITAGELAIALPSHPEEPFTFEFDLARIGDLGPVETSCESGYLEADIGRCIPGSNWRSTSSFGNRIQHEITDWVAASGWLQTDSVESPFANAVSSHWLEELICYDRSDDASGASGFHASVHYNWLSAVETDTILDYSRDRYCGHHDFQRAVPLGLQRDAADSHQGGGESPTVGASDLLAGCLTELGRSIPSQPTMDDWFGLPSDALPSCVSLPRLYPALEWAFSHNIQGNAPSGVHPRSMRTGQRLLSQFLEVLSFVGRQSREENALGTVLFAEPGGDGQSHESEFDNALAAVEEGIDLVLSPGISEALASAPRQVLRKPDYRYIAPQPVAYWTFDSEDSTSQTAVDLVGDAHLDLATRQFDANLAGADGDATYAIWATPTSSACPYFTYSRLFSISSDAGDVVEIYCYRTFSTGTEFVMEVGGYFYNYGSAPFGYPAFIGFSHRADGNVISPFVQTTYSSGTASLGSPTTVSPVEVPGGNRYGYIASAVQEALVFEGHLGASEVSALYDRGPSGMSMDNPGLVAFSTGYDDSKDEQSVGLPVHMLETGSEYLRTVQAYVDREAVVTYATCYQGGTSLRIAKTLDRAGAAARRVLWLEALAKRLRDRAAVARGCAEDDHCEGLTGATCATVAGEQVCAVGGVPLAADLTWDEHYENALRELVATRTRLQQSVNSMQACGNPLGIPESALPLYFGDVVGNNSRAFASSDYLLKTWASPAVATASSLLDVARDSWMNMRNSEVQQVMNDFDAARRLEGIETQNTEEIIRLCGLSGVDPQTVRETFESGSWSPDTCYLNESDPGCTSNTPKASCFTGEMGAAVLAILGTRVDVDTALANIEATQQRYEQESAYCSGLQDDLEGVSSNMEKHNQRMAGLRNKKKVGGFVGSFVSGAIGIATGNPSAALGFIGDITSEAVGGESLESAEAHFQLYLQQQSANQQVTACFHGADMHKTGLDAQYSAVSRARIQVESALLNLANMYSRVQQLLGQGKAAIEREERRGLPSVAHHYWLDERVDKFKKDLKWAKRLTYLSMLAVEYEFQQSLGLRDDILTAAHPVQLEDAIRLLEQEQASRTINGRRPEDSSIVLSLRDDILQIAARETVEPGERAWTETRRFTERLNDPEFAMYDDDGNYLGQGIPFAMEEDGALELRCAERLWRVTATIQGDILDADAPGAPVFIMKNNTFSSQWCTSKGDGSDYQVSSVQPSVQVFKPDEDPIPELQNSSYTTAMLYPWFNVPRSQFYQEQYVEGSSEELAGRGLYGNYVLLFPEPGMLERTDCTVDGLDLAQVEDVLIRFDFLSVDDLNL